jgi:hypothetical protein
MPLSLSDEDLALLNQLAAPVAFGSGTNSCARLPMRSPRTRSPGPAWSTGSRGISNEVSRSPPNAKPASPTHPTRKVAPWLVPDLVVCFYRRYAKQV